MATTMRGRRIPISYARRIIIDLMRFSMNVPLVSVTRHMNIGRLLQRRTARDERPMWVSIFTRAYGLVSEEFPEFRRVYVKLPWPHLCEYSTSIGMVVIERDYLGEPGVFMVRVQNFAKNSVASIDRVLNDAKTAPIKQVREFRRMFIIARLPLPIRRTIWWLGLNIGRLRARYFGTFAITSLSALGVATHTLLTPGPAILTFSPIAEDGSVIITLHWDHRVMDGVVIARALARLEDILNGPIADELAN